MNTHSDPELEGKVLGSVMLDRESLPLVADLVRPETFYTERHRHIYEAMQGLFVAGTEIDVVTVADALRKKGTLPMCGGETYLVELTMAASAVHSVENHARVLAEKAMLRSLHAVGLDLSAGANDEAADPFELLDRAERRIMEAAGILQIKSPKMINLLLPDVIDRIDRLASGEATYFGSSTGLHEFDHWTGGLEKKLLYVVAGRPSQGKSALAMSMAGYIADSDPVGLFSLEMSDNENMIRLIAMESGIPYQDLKQGQFKKNDEQARAYTNALRRLNGKRLILDDSPAIGIAELKAKSRRLLSEHRIKGIFVDYLQLMKMGKADTRDMAIGEVTRGLKQMAKDLDIWIVLLSQLSRAVEARPDKKPMLSDLRESGNIEQDADVVLFVYRPDFYGIDKMPDDTDSKGKAVCLLAKQRNGRVGEFYLNFIGDKMLFVNPAPVAIVPPAIPAERRYETDDERPF